MLISSILYFPISSKYNHVYIWQVSPQPNRGYTAISKQKHDLNELTYRFCNIINIHNRKINDSILKTPTLVHIWR